VFRKNSASMEGVMWGVSGKGQNLRGGQRLVPLNGVNELYNNAGRVSLSGEWI